MRCVFIAPVIATLVFVMAHYIEYVDHEYLYRNKKINVDTNKVYVFETKSGLSPDKCVEECKLRKACSFINYHRYAQVCYMLKVYSDNTIIGVADSKGFIYAKKSDWNMTYHDERCSNCSDKETCHLSNNASVRCVTTGCGIPPAVDNTIILGNRYIVGSVIQYKCRHADTSITMHGSQSKIICQDNGTWTEPTIQCVYVVCKDNWALFDNSCYWLENGRKNWTEAKTNCESLEAHLVDIGTQDEADFLNEYSLSCYKKYIGLNDKSEEGVFRWSDNSRLQENMLTNWGEDEPNNHNSDNEDSVMLRNNEWFDNVDTGSICSICEYEL